MGKNYATAGNTLYVAGGLDVGNVRVKGLFGGKQYRSESFIATNPAGKFSLDNRDYFSFPELPPFLVGAAASYQASTGDCTSYAVASDPLVLKPLSTPYWIIAAAASTIPQILEEGVDIVCLDLVLSLQDLSLEGATYQALSQLPEFVEISKGGRTFRLDCKYLADNLLMVVEGHFVGFYSAAKLKTRPELGALLVDIGGRTIHATSTNSDGDSASNTLTVNSSGVLTLLESLCESKKLAKLLPVGTRLSPHDLADLLALGTNPKVNDLVKSSLKKWFLGADMVPIWGEISKAAALQKPICFLGGGTGLPGFEEVVLDILKKKKAEDAAKNILFASGLLKCSPDFANAKSLEMAGISRLKKRLASM